jgi:serine/threonine protein kinase
VGRLADHENIVELKDFGVLPNGQMYMQFEFIDGTPLESFLVEWVGDTWTLSDRAVRQIVEPTCSA